MTIEEKAQGYADGIVPIMVPGSEIELTIDNMNEFAQIDYLAGYAEAMRWRDPKEELPEKDEMVLIQVQIRYTDTIVKVFPSIGILSECGLTHKMRLVDTHRSNGLIIGWRPIE